VNDLICCEILTKGPQPRPSDQLQPCDHCGGELVYAARPEMPASAEMSPTLWYRLPCGRWLCGECAYLASPEKKGDKTVTCTYCPVAHEVKLSKLHSYRSLGSRRLPPLAGIYEGRSARSRSPAKLRSRQRAAPAPEDAVLGGAPDPAVNTLGATAPATLSLDFAAAAAALAPSAAPLTAPTSSAETSFEDAVNATLDSSRPATTPEPWRPTAHDARTALDVGYQPEDLMVRDPVAQDDYDAHVAWRAGTVAAEADPDADDEVHFEFDARNADRNALRHRLQDGRPPP
jgi:hypothetical protein